MIINKTFLGKSLTLLFSRSIRTAIISQLYTRNSFNFGKFLKNYPLKNKEMQYQSNEQLKNIPAADSKQLIDHIIQIDNLQEMLKQKQQIFQKERKFVPAYLSQLKKLLNKLNYNQNKRELFWINDKLNEMADFNMSSEEFVQIVQFHAHYKQLSKKSPLMINFGFQKKVTMISATKIHKGQFKLGQAISLFSLLLKLEATSLMLFMNFTKYLKIQFLKPNHQNTIKLQHILAVLNSQFIKRNLMILENVLYDQVLNYFLLNQKNLVKGSALFQKLQMATILLCMDIKKTYKSNYQDRRDIITSFLREVQQTINQKWMDELIGGAKRVNIREEINSYQIVHLIETINYIKQNKYQSQNFELLFEQLIKAIINAMHLGFSKKYQKNIPQVQSSILMRILFNPQVIDRWINNDSLKNQIHGCLQRMVITKQQTLYPLHDLIHFRKQKCSPTIPMLIIMLQKINGICFKQSIISWSSCFILIDYSNLIQGLEIIKKVQSIYQIHELSSQNSFSFIFLMNYYSLKNGIMAQKIQSSLNTWVDQQIKQTNIKQIKHQQSVIKLYNSYLNLRQFNTKTALFSNLLQSLFQKIPTLYNKIQTYKKNSSLDQSSLYIFQMLIAHKCLINTKLSQQIDYLFNKLMDNDVLKHHYLTICYPEACPVPKKYSRVINLLSDPKLFINNMKVISSIFNQDKYHYFIWDIFIKNYSKLPVQTRKQSSQLLEQIFMKAYTKQNLRKVVILTVFTNYINSGIIIAPKAQLKSIFERAIDQLILSQQNIQFHHQCYLQIILNAYSCDILIYESLTKIMEHCFKKQPQIKDTCTLMLFYGSVLTTLRLSSPLLNQKAIDNQLSYLKFLINKKAIQIKAENSQMGKQIQSSVNKQINNNKKFDRTIFMTGKLGIILLKMLGQQIIIAEDLICRFVEQCYDFSEWLGLGYAYNPDVLSKNDNNSNKFKLRFNSAMKAKLIFFRERELLSEQHWRIIQPKFN